MPEYRIEDIFKKRKYLTLMFSLEKGEQYGSIFDHAVKNMEFSKLNHFLKATETGEKEFPGLKYDNLRRIVEETQEKQARRGRTGKWKITDMLEELKSKKRLYPLGVEKLLNYIWKGDINRRYGRYLEVQRSGYGLILHVMGIDYHVLIEEITQNEIDHMIEKEEKHGKIRW